jgi:hypothetical protein
MLHEMGISLVCRRARPRRSGKTVQTGRPIASMRIFLQWSSSISVASPRIRTNATQALRNVIPAFAAHGQEIVNA